MRKVLKTAYEAGLIKEERLWLQALQERNNVAHSYNQKIAMDIVRLTKEQFYPMFWRLKEEAEQKWI